ncbi:MAG: ABC transporter permease [Actinomycetota bacterium]|nr:ABC transporter permease [Actinomycetota bacterium]
MVEPQGGLMEFLASVLAWFVDPANWQGRSGIPNRTLEHLQLSGLALACAAAVAIPGGVMLGHVRKGGVLAVAVVNVGRALPSFAVIALALPFSLRLGLGLGFWPTFLALFLLAIPPMFTNAYTAVREVGADVVESARGMGMREHQVLVGIEVALAWPVMLAATRVAAVQVIATAPLGALVGWGGLGRYIIDGFAQQDYVEVMAGAVLVAVVALGVDASFGLVERVAMPSGVRRVGRAPDVVEAAHPV